MKDFKQLFILASVFVITPSHSFKNCSFFRKLILKSYYILHTFLICSVGLYFSSKIFWDDKNDIIRSMTIIPEEVIRSGVCIFHSVISTLRLVFDNANKWEKLFGRISARNCMFRKIQHKSCMTSRLEIYSIASFIVAVIIFNNAVWIKHSGLAYQTKYWFLYYFIFTENIRMTISYTFIREVENKFKDLNTFVKEWFKQNKGKSALKLIQIENRKLNKTVHLLNNLQGLQIFFGILQSSTMFICYIDNCVELFRHNSQLYLIIFFSSLTTGISVLVRKRNFSYVKISPLRLQDV